MATVFKRKKNDPLAPWIVQYFDHSGRRREHSTRTSRHEVAERIAAKIEADAALRRDGVVDAKAERYALESRRPISEHLDGFSASIQSRARSPTHLADTAGRAR